MKEQEPEFRANIDASFLRLRYLLLPMILGVNNLNTNLTLKLDEIELPYKVRIALTSSEDIEGLSDTYYSNWEFLHVKRK